MNFKRSFKTALRAIAANKLRSGLTMLGIIIGVGSVVAMISIGSGAASGVTSSIQNLGSNLLTVSPEVPDSRQGGARMAGGGGTTLTLQDGEVMGQEFSTIKNVSPEYTGQAQIIYINKNVNTRVYGVTSKYEEVHNAHAKYGEFVGEDDEKMQSKVAVLGQTVVTDLFAGEDPIGKIIKIKNIPFRVIGVMESKGQSGFMNQDDMIFVPLSTAQKRLFGVDYLGSISVQVRTEEEMDLAVSQINTLLMSRHKITDENQADFQIRSQAEMLATMSAITGTLTMLLGGIAAISLLVGGIGIMNIMLVSVTERTREIGIRKAVGARRRDILVQFLIESLILSFLGAVIGVIVGVAGSIIISSIGGWKTVITANSIVLAFTFSAAIGVFFGIYPARRASMLSPITALRFE